MVSGTKLWPHKITQDIAPRQCGDTTIHTYSNILPSLYHSLQQTAQKFPLQVFAVSANNAQCTFAQLLQWTDQLAAALIDDFHLTKGNRVGILLDNSVEFCAALYAISKVGAVAVPLPYKYKAPAIHSLAEKASLSLLLCHREYRPLIEGLPVPAIFTQEEYPFGFQHILKPNHCATRTPAGFLEDDCLIMFTSGTTSKSKAVLLKNYNVMHAIESYRRVLDITPQDRSIIPIPIYHITGIVALLGLFVHVGATLWLQTRFDAAKVLACVQENNLTFLHASPTVFSLLLDEQQNFPSLPSLQKFACGSSNMPPENIRSLYNWIPSAKFHTIYGLTETSSPGTVMPEGAATNPFIGSSGIPIPGLELKIADENNRELNAGKTGEVLLRGTVVTPRYLTGNNQDYFSDGWLKTGDLGFCNVQGYLYIVDRKKDMINRGGEKICSFDIENELHALNEIAEAAVVGIPHQRYGEVPVALVRLKPDVAISSTEILTALRTSLSSYQLPVEVRFTSALPKTEGGKINKPAIKKFFTEK